MPLDKLKKQTGLPLPLPTAKKAPIEVDEKKLAAAREYIAGIRDVAGIAGDVALRAFSQGTGFDFKITNNEIVSEARPKGDTGLYIDGKPIGDKDTIETVRGYLKAEYESQNKKKNK